MHTGRKVFARFIWGWAEPPIPHCQEAWIWLKLHRLACKGLRVSKASDISKSRLLTPSSVTRSRSYVALKIHTANIDVSGELSIQKYTANSSTDLSSRVVHLLLDSFELEGPNDRHTCFVTEPTGPGISAFLTAPFGSDDAFASRRFPTLRTKNFLRNVLSGL